jgi:hypothetical protein
VGGQRQAPAALPPGQTRFPLLRRLGGPPWTSAENLAPALPGFDPRTVQPVDTFKIVHIKLHALYYTTLYTFVSSASSKRRSHQSPITCHLHTAPRLVDQTTPHHTHTTSHTPGHNTPHTHTHTTLHTTPHHTTPTDITHLQPCLHNCNLQPPANSQFVACPMLTRRDQL